jgi:mannose-6-phosphate isomerase-like protein (cupin superfamily)
MRFQTRTLPKDPDVVAPDGSDVRVLLRLDRGSMAHFELAAGQTSQAVAHRTVEEIWYVVRGRGEMWRKQSERADTVDIKPGVCLTIPVGTHFQFRNIGDEPLAVIGVTMPPGPDGNEAYEVDGQW